MAVEKEYRILEEYEVHKYKVTHTTQKRVKEACLQNI
jgi:hypothetical protein